MAGWRSVDEQRAYLAPLIQRWYPRFVTGGQLYARALLTLSRPEMRVLDAGAGTGGYIHLLKGRVKTIIGVDEHAESLQKNTTVDERLIADLAAIPLPGQSIDLITAEFVFEHLENPSAVFQEWHRLLRPGGKIIALTPNSWNPIMLISRMTPLWFHAKMKRRLLKKPEHVHRTYYRANTVKQIQRLSATANLSVSYIRRAGNPEYLAVHPVTAIPSILLERLQNLPGLRWMQMYLVVEIQRQTTT